MKVTHGKMTMILTEMLEMLIELKDRLLEFTLENDPGAKICYLGKKGICIWREEVEICLDTSTTKSAMNRKVITGKWTRIQ